MSDTEDKGYTVKDRRFHQVSEEEKTAVTEEETGKTAAPEEEAAPEEAWDAKSGPDEVPLPEITFSSFLFSLSTSAFVHLGAVPDPASGKADRNLSLAKQTIDLLGLLREKTRNNLSREEEDLFDHLLYDLRMRYIKEAG
ncbi:MAG: DUF1844 domain-containing protein [Syntrophales bacterium]|nr:DUF1844 domain-containing protein [Syntrophales bacterium]